MTDTEKLYKISMILDNHDFKLSNTYIYDRDYSDVLKELEGKSLSDTVKSLVDYKNCVAEVMKVIYNVKEREELYEKAE